MAHLDTVGPYSRRWRVLPTLARSDIRLSRRLTPIPLKSQVTWLYLELFDMTALQLRERMLIASEAVGSAVPDRVSAASGQMLEKSA
jgi:hypothetical protein